MHSAQNCVERTLLDLGYFFERKLLLTEQKHLFLFVGKRMDRPGDLLSQFSIFHFSGGLMVFRRGKFRELLLICGNKKMAAFFADLINENVMSHTEKPCAETSVVAVSGEFADDFQPGFFKHIFGINAGSTSMTSGLAAFT